MVIPTVRPLLANIYIKSTFIILNLHLPDTLIHSIIHIIWGQVTFDRCIHDIMFKSGWAYLLKHVIFLYGKNNIQIFSWSFCFLKNWGIKQGPDTLGKFSTTKPHS